MPPMKAATARSNQPLKEATKVAGMGQPTRLLTQRLTRAQREGWRKARVRGERLQLQVQ